MVMSVQYLILIMSLVVGFVFCYANFYIFRGLKLGNKRLDNNNEIVETHIIREQIMIPSSPIFDENQMKRELFYMYQEQMKNYITAKVEIIRDLSKTNNKLLLSCAEIVKNDQDENKIKQIIDINEKVKYEAEDKLKELNNDIQNVKFTSMDLWVEHQQQLIEA